MPKEVIKYTNEYVIRDNRIVYNPDAVGSEAIRPDEEMHHTEELALHWSKGPGGVIQLSIQLDANMVREQLRLYDQQEWLGEEIKPGMLMFYSGDLRRSELQLLVKHTRRARDDVYGADE